MKKPNKENYGCIEEYWIDLEYWAELTEKNEKKLQDAVIYAIDRLKMHGEPSPHLSAVLDDLI